MGCVREGSREEFFQDELTGQLDLFELAAYLDKVGDMFEEMAKALFDAIRFLQARKFFEDLDHKEADGE